MNAVKPRLMDAEALAQYLSVSKTTARAFGRDAGAIVRIGRRCVYDKKAIDAAIEKKKQQATTDATHV